MRVWTWWMAGLLAAGTALAARAPAAEACMTGRIAGARAQLFVLATAGADTVRAGPGPIRYGPREVDSAALAAIHGQRFRLDRVGGDVPAALAGAEGGEAVLVPYGWECRDTWPWRESRWARPGAQLFADASLRPRGQWVGGVPTFDVEMIHDVYPDGWDVFVDSAPADPLSPAQVFELQVVLPTYDEMREAPWPAYRGLLAWARANPGLAGRFPATVTLAEANEALQPCVPAYDPHPVAGTYRATVVVEGRDTLTTVFRTDPRGFPECGPPEPRLDLASVQPRMADTARLYVDAPGDEPALAAATPGAGGRTIRCGGGSVLVINRPRTEADGRRAWEADFNYLALPYCGPAHAGLDAAAEAVFEAWAGSVDDDAPPPPREPAPGWFREGLGGEVTLEQTWRANGRVMLELRATRISTRTQARD